MPEISQRNGDDVVLKAQRTDHGIEASGRARLHAQYLIDGLAGKRDIHFQ